MRVVLSSVLLLVACTDHRPRASDLSLPDATVDAALACGETSALFQTRIAPLLGEARPSSCNGCHLTGLDLSDFVRGTACQSMACLIEQDMVDLARPGESHILDLIARGAAFGDAQTRQAALLEFRAFAAWIEQSARCHTQVCGVVAAPCGAPVTDAGAPADGGVPDMTPDAAEPPGPCATRTLADRFELLVWRWRSRCYHCDQGDGVELGPADAPTWMARGAARASADETMARLLDGPLIDWSEPDQSVLLLKPLAERVGGAEHGGGTKFKTLEDPAYLDFQAWIWDAAVCRDDTLVNPHPARDGSESP